MKKHPKFRTLTIKQAVRAVHLGYVDDLNNTFENEDKVPVNDGYASDAYWWGKVMAHAGMSLSKALAVTRAGEN